MLKLVDHVVCRQFRRVRCIGGLGPKPARGMLNFTIGRRSVESSIHCGIPLYASMFANRLVELTDNTVFVISEVFTNIHIRNTHVVVICLNRTTQEYLPQRRLRYEFMTRYKQRRFYFVLFDYTYIHDVNCSSTVSGMRAHSSADCLCISTSA